MSKFIVCFAVIFCVTICMDLFHGITFPFSDDSNQENGTLQRR
jgi:hypothetical protein